MNIEQILNISSVPFIVAIVHELLRLYKTLIKSKIIDNKQERFIRMMPLIAGILGLIIGIGAYYLQIVGDTLIMAIIIGIVSGLSATGVDQILKQLKK